MKLASSKAVEFFVSVGWGRAHGAGIAANLQAESKFDPAAVGDGGLAYGIAQWHPDRQANFQRAFGKSIKGSTLDEQLAFVHWELNNTEQRAGMLLRACTTAAEAGDCVSRYYERPADREGEAKKRAALATQIYAWGDEPIAKPKPIPHIKEQPMGGLVAAFLPSIFELFAGRASAAVQKLSNAPKEVADKFIAESAGKLVDLSGVQVTDNASALKAVAAVVDDPAKMAALEQHAIDYLEKVAPFLDKIAAYEKAEWDASEASVKAAADRNQEAKDVPLKQDRAFILAAAIIALVAFVVTSVLWKDALLYWLLPKDVIERLDTVGFSTDMQSFVIGAIVGGALTAVISYFLGSNKQSAAKDAAIETLSRATKGA